MIFIAIAYIINLMVVSGLKKKKNKGNSNRRRTNVFGTPQKRAAFLRQMCAESLGSQPTFKHDSYVNGGKT